MGAICCFSSLPLVLAVSTFEIKFSFNKKSTVYSNSVSVFDDTKFRIESVQEDLKNQEWRWNSESPGKKILAVFYHSVRNLFRPCRTKQAKKKLCTVVTLHGDYFTFIDNRNYIFSTLKIPTKKSHSASQSSKCKYFCLQQYFVSFRVIPGGLWTGNQLQRKTFHIICRQYYHLKNTLLKDLRHRQFY